MFCRTINKIVSIVFILCLVKPTHCMNISSGGGKCIINGRVFVGNSICIVNNNMYIDGILQDGNSAGCSSQSSWKKCTSQSKSIPVNNNSSIIIKNSIGDIDVLSHDDTDAYLLITRLGATEEDLRQVDADISQTAETLQIETKYLRPVVNALINYRLLLPKTNQFSCSFTNSSGDTSIKEITGEVDATSMSGNINLQEIHGVIQAKTSSGDMKFNTITGSVTATTLSGKMKAKKIDGTSQFTSSSGDMDIDTASRKTNIQTASGTLDVKNIAAILVAASSSGDMHISNVASDFNGRSASGTIRAVGIKGNSTLNTSSGDIKLYKNTINAPITIVTSSGDIEICSDTFDAMLEAETRSGALSSDFAVSVQKNRVSTQVGNGGPRVSLKTSSGDITLTQN